MNFISLIGRNLNNKASKEQIALLSKYNIYTDLTNDSQMVKRSFSIADTNRVLNSVMRSSWLDEETLVRLDDYLFDMKYVCCPELDIEHIDRIALAIELTKNKKYMQMLKRNKRMHSPERARIVGILKNAKTEVDMEMAKIDISRAFERIAEGETDYKYLVKIWIKFLNIYSQFNTGLPSALLEFVSKDNYKTVSVYMRNYLGSVEHCRNADEIKKAKCNAKEVYELITNKIDEYDVPSLLWLSRYYKDNGDVDKAEKQLIKASSKDSTGNSTTSLVTFYEKQFKEISKSRKEEDLPIIESLKDKIERVYEETIDSIKDLIAKEGKDKLDRETLAKYVTFISMAARFEKSIGNFDLAKDLLDEVDESFPEYHRALVELGMIYQSPSPKNEFHNLKKSAETFRRAYTLVISESYSKNERIKHIKFCLVPLANTLYYMKSYDEAKGVCNQILDLDGEEVNAKKLLVKINEVKKTA